MTISGETIKEMKRLGYHFIKLGFKITSFEKFKKVIGVLTRKLYWIKKRFFPEPKSRFKISDNQQTLDNEVPMSSYRESLLNVSKVNQQNRPVITYKQQDFEVFG